MTEPAQDEESERSDTAGESTAPEYVVSESTENPISNIEVEKSMEVHHHAHHGGKKNWRTYFWEFCMLFLAVFCGFLAEYQLEHKIESDRSKELARSLYQELRSDSITAALKVQNRIKQETALKYLIGFFRDSSLTDLSKEFAIHFEYGINFRSPSLFEPRTVMLEQLRNSGSLRYFKNEKLQALAGDITVAIKNIYNRQELESDNRNLYINPFIIRHYDYKFNEQMMKDVQNVFVGVEAYEKNDAFVPFQLNQVDKIDRTEIVGILSFYCGNVISSTRQVHIQKYIEINAELLKVLRENFEID